MDFKGIQKADLDSFIRKKEKYGGKGKEGITFN